jgi:coenzyme F420-reducing hydrogenase beta subunit
MISDQDGFFYPNINFNQCINCRLCEKYCPVHYSVANDMKNQSVFAVWLKNSDILKTSSSGGAFSAIAEYVLKRGGSVFGCAFTSTFQIKHICVNDLQSLKKLRGSKYVQSDTMDTFSQAKRLLQSGKLVLYSGTPCQIAGIKAYLHKDYENLITIDLICHGVPSPLLFSKYIHWLEEKIHGKVLSYRFRDKEKNGWSHTGRFFYHKNNKVIQKDIISKLDPYYSLFLKGDIYRECCYKCMYANACRQGDFTIGDFWGFEHIHPEYSIRNGISLLLVNNKKAADILPFLSTYLTLLPSTFEEAAKHNGQLTHPTVTSKKRKDFLCSARSDSFQDVVFLWKKYYRKEIFFTICESLVPSKVKSFLKPFYKKFKASTCKD